MILAIFLAFIILYLAEFLLQKSFNSPCSLLLLSFIMATGLIAVNTENWEVVIYDDFPVYIFTAVMAFAAGCLLTEVICNAVSGQTGAEITQNVRFRDNYPAAMMAVLSVACAIAYVYLLTKGMNFSGGMSKVLGEIYARAKTGSTRNFVLHQMLEIVIAVSKISIFQLFVIQYFRKRKTQAGLIIIPVLAAMACMILSTDRNIFLRFIIYAVCLWVLFYSGSVDESRRKKNWHIFRYALVFLMVVVIVFYGLGKAKGYTSNFERMIGIYGGSGLYNFNLYLHDFSGNDLQMGNSTFATLQNTLRALGIIEGTYDDTLAVDPMIIHYSSNWYAYASNVYSAMKPYLDDFGYFGMIIFPFIMGGFFETLYWFAKKNRFGFSWICYALLVYPLLYFTIAEQFFARLHLGIVYEIMWVLIFYYLIYGKKGIWRVRQAASSETIENGSW